MTADPPVALRLWDPEVHELENAPDVASKGTGTVAVEDVGDAGLCRPLIHDEDVVLPEVVRGHGGRRIQHVPVYTDLFWYIEGKHARPGVGSDPGHPCCCDTLLRSVAERTRVTPSSSTPEKLDCSSGGSSAMEFLTLHAHTP